MSDFESKVWLLLIDKGALAVVAALLALLVGFMVERYRRTQAVLVELGKIRAVALVRNFSRLVEFQTAVETVVHHLAKIEPAKLPRKPEDYPEGDPRRTDEHAREVMELLEREMIRGQNLGKLKPEEQAEMVKAEERVNATVDQVKVGLEADRYLLGEELTSLALSFLMTVRGRLPELGAKATTESEVERLRAKIDAYLPRIEKP